MMLPSREHRIRPLRLVGNNSATNWNVVDVYVDLVWFFPPVSDLHGSLFSVTFRLGGPMKSGPAYFSFSEEFTVVERNLFLVQLFLSTRFCGLLDRNCEC